MVQTLQKYLYTSEMMVNLNLNKKMSNKFEDCNGYGISPIDPGRMYKNGIMTENQK